MVFASFLRNGFVKSLTREGDGSTVGYVIVHPTHTVPLLPDQTLWQAQLHAAVH